VAIDSTTMAENRAERQRLRRLVDRLSDDDLSRPISPNWTVADALAHLAFWDRRAFVLLARWTSGGPVADSPVDVDTVNDTVLFLAKRLPPRAAAEEAVAAAEGIDQLLEAASPNLLEWYRAADTPFPLDRGAHRRAHIDEIERQLLRGVKV
jgi:hypothetical protein